MLATLHAQAPPPRAQVGPLQAWVARSESGACQLRLRNAGDTTVLAWTVTVRSEERPLRLAVPSRRLA